MLPTFRPQVALVEFHNFCFVSRGYFLLNGVTYGVNQPMNVYQEFHKVRKQEMSAVSIVVIFVIKKIL